MNPELRSLGSGDVDSLIGLWRDSGLPFKPTGRDSKEELERQLVLPQINVIGLFDRDRLVASVFVTHDGRKGWINRLAVLPDFRRQGLGRMLIEAAEKWLVQEGMGIFACMIEPGNQVSNAVFESSDYKLFEGMYYYTKRLHPGI